VERFKIPPRLVIEPSSTEEESGDPRSPDDDDNDSEDVMIPDILRKRELSDDERRQMVLQVERLDPEYSQKRVQWYTHLRQHGFSKEELDALDDTPLDDLRDVVLDTALRKCREAEERRRDDEIPDVPINRGPSPIDRTYEDVYYGAQQRDSAFERAKALARDPRAPSHTKRTARLNFLKESLRKPRRGHKSRV